MEALIYGVLDTRLPDVITRIKGPKVSSAIATVTWRTDISVTGAGYLHALLSSTANPSTTIHGHNLIKWRVTVDGGTPTEINPSQGLYGVNGARGAKGVILGLRFTTSLVVETHNLDSTSHTFNTTIVHSLDG